MVNRRLLVHVTAKGEIEYEYNPFRKKNFKLLFPLSCLYKHSLIKPTGLLAIQTSWRKITEGEGEKVEEETKEGRIESRKEREERKRQFLLPRS